jgi:c-di-GMP-binding flagellar brake protein YcgR
VHQLKLKPTKGDLKVWEKVRIVAGDGPEAGVFEARIEDFVPEGIVVTYPELVSGGVLLRQGLTVRVQITREDAAYQFTSIVRSHSDASIGRRVILTPPASLRRIQRRQFARIDISSEVKYTRFRSETDWMNWPEGVSWKSTRSIDVSGGGVLIKLTEDIPRESLLLLKIDFMPSAGLPEVTFGVVCRECIQEASRCCGIKFVLKNDLHRYIDRKVMDRLPEELTAFDVNAQDRLVMYLFRKQIELRRKGLI